MAQKKSFKDNPALQFITPPEEEIQSAPAPAEQNTSVPMKPNPLYIETRSKRLNLLIQPSLHTKLKDIAKGQDISINELIHRALEEYADRRGR